MQGLALGLASHSGNGQHIALPFLRYCAAVRHFFRRRWRMLTFEQLEG